MPIALVVDPTPQGAILGVIAALPTAFVAVIGLGVVWYPVRFVADVIGATIKWIAEGTWDWSESAWGDEAQATSD